MKKLSFLFLSFFLIAATVAQTPQYYNYQINEGTNYFPFGVTTGKEVQWLYPAGNLNTPTAAPSGMITKVYFYMGFTNGNATLTDLLIKLGQTTLTNLPTGQIYTGQLDTVYFRASVNLVSTIGAWMGITLDNPYMYDSTKSLIVDVSQCGATNTTVVVCQHSYTGNIRRCYINGTTSCVFTYSGQDANAANFGVDISVLPPNGWTSQTSGVTSGLNTVSAVNANVGWIGGNSGVVLRTVNGGTNWTNVTGSPIGTNAIYCICGIDANTCLVSTSPSATYVFRTTNGGANWTQVFTQAGGFIDDIKFKNATTGFMYGDPVGGRWSLWKSTDAGATWDSAGLYLAQAGSEAGWNNAMWLSGDNLWFGTNNTRVYKSTNFGSAWTFGATTGSVNSYSVAFNGNIGFTGQSALLKSTDAGGTWASVTLPGTGTAYSFNGVLNRFWYDRGSQIYWSSDNGANFASQYTGTGTYQAMNLVQDGNIIRGWSVTSAGGIAAYFELISGVSNNQNQVPDNYVLAQNYPNPFNPSTKISFTLPKAGNVKLAVFDILGREVATLVNEFATAGIHTIDFNASNLSSGVYLYKIQAGDFTDTKKMVLMK
jgi:photosystem II stability/assembly factor-like uncharacterized protein